MVNDKLESFQKGKHRRTRSTITAEMLSNTDIVFKESEKWGFDNFIKFYSPLEKNPLIKKKHRAIIISNYKQTDKRKINSSNFAPILEEDNFDHVVVNKTKEDNKEEINGPSYLDAIKFASVYNTQSE